MAHLIKALQYGDRVVLSILKIITIICFILLTILISANVFVRFVPVASLHWFDEIIELLYAYLVFYGSAAIWITREHFSVGPWIEAKIIKNDRSRHVFRMVLELLSLVFVCILFYYSLRLTVIANDVTNVFAIPKRILYSCLPISAIIMVLSSIGHIFREFVIVIEPGREAIERLGL